MPQISIPEQFALVCGHAQSSKELSHLKVWVPAMANQGQPRQCSVSSVLLSNTNDQGTGRAKAGQYSLRSSSCGQLRFESNSCSADVVCSSQSLTSSQSCVLSYKINTSMSCFLGLEIIIYWSIYIYHRS